MQLRPRGLSAVVAENVTRLRESFGLTQEQLAYALKSSGVLPWTQAILAAVEVGKRRVQSDELLALAAFFVVGIEELLVSPDRGPVRIGRLDWDAESLFLFLTKPPEQRDSFAVELLEHHVHEYIGVIVPADAKRERELNEWVAQGGDPEELTMAWGRLDRGEWKGRSYAAWKRHAKARLFRRADARRPGQESQTGSEAEHERPR